MTRGKIIRNIQGDEGVAFRQVSQLVAATNTSAALDSSVITDGLDSRVGVVEESFPVKLPTEAFCLDADITGNPSGKSTTIDCQLMDATITGINNTVKVFTLKHTLGRKPVGVIYCGKSGLNVPDGMTIMVRGILGTVTSDTLQVEAIRTVGSTAQSIKVRLLLF